MKNSINALILATSMVLTGMTVAGPYPQENHDKYDRVRTKLVTMINWSVRDPFGRGCQHFAEIGLRQLERGDTAVQRGHNPVDAVAYLLPAIRSIQSAGCGSFIQTQ